MRSTKNTRAGKGWQENPDTRKVVPKRSGASGDDVESGYGGEPGEFGELG